MAHDEEFMAFASARAAELFRCALLLTGEWYSAEDLVQDTLTTIYRRWSKVSSAEQPGAYARRVLLNTFLSGRRRRSSTEVPTATIPPAAGRDDPALRATLLAGLRSLAPRDRAVVVLRYWMDLDAATTGELVGCSPEAVRTRARRALGTLREVLADDFDHLLAD